MMIKHAIHITACGTMLLLAACQSTHTQRTDGQQAAAPMQGNTTVWVLESGQLNGKPLDTASGEVTLNTADQTVFTGTAAINQYRAPIRISGSNITHTETITTTLMAGEMAAMRLESDYLEALGATTTLAHEGNHLILRGDGVELRFRAKP